RGRLVAPHISIGGQSRTGYRAPAPPFPELDTVKEGHAYTLEAVPSSQQCKLWSGEVDGFVHRSDYGVVHSSGQRSVTYIPERVTDYDDTTEVLKDCTATREQAQILLEEDDVGWTWGQIARHVTRWMAIQQGP